MSCKIITTVQPINRDLQEYSYTHMPMRGGEAGKPYSAEMSNEAPVKLLLDMANDNGTPVTEVICVVSEEVGESYRDKDGKYCKDSHGNEITDSSYAYFQKKINQHIAERHLPPVHYVPVSYELGASGKSIPGIIREFTVGDEVMIDMTSGQRTLPAYITLCMEAMEQQNIRIVDIVYADLQQKQIRHEKHIYDMLDLIQGVSDFTTHGKARTLRECFEKSGSRFLKIAEEMEAFSNKLITCRVGRLKEDVDKIHKSLSDEMKAGPDIESSLRTMDRVFYALLPSIRQNFVAAPEPGAAKAETDSWKIIHLIEWCVQRDYLQQALSIYRENIAKIVNDMGLIVPPEDLGKVFEKYKDRFNDNRDIKEYALELLYRIKEKTEKATLMGEVKIIQKLPGGTSRKDYNDDYSKLENSQMSVQALRLGKKAAEEWGYRINMNDENYKDCLCYSSYIQNIRNAVMHANEIFSSIGGGETEYLPLCRKEQGLFNGKYCYTDDDKIKKYGEEDKREEYGEEDIKKWNKVERKYRKGITEKVLTADNIRQTLSEAVTLLKEAIQNRKTILAREPEKTQKRDEIPAQEPKKTQKRDEIQKQEEELWVGKVVQLTGTAYKPINGNVSGTIQGTHYRAYVSRKVFKDAGRNAADYGGKEFRVRLTKWANHPDNPHFEAEFAADTEIKTEGGSERC